jgi:asparagine synthetase B (glutamine-hydrolysing)
MYIYLIEYNYKELVEELEHYKNQSAKVVEVIPHDYEDL